MNKAIACFECAQIEAAYLMFWRKIQGETHLEVLFDPKLICQPCRDQWTHTQSDLLEAQPNFIPFYKFIKENQKKTPARLIGWLTSVKTREANQMHNDFWRKKLWYISKIMSSRAAQDLDE